MNFLDLIIIVLMAFLLGRGIFRGFFREIGSIAGVILGIWIANVYHPQMTKYLETLLPEGKYLPLISFAMIFLIVLVLCNLGGALMKKIFEKSLLGWADRSLGAGLAVLKGIIIIYFGIILLTFLLPSKTPLVGESKLAPAVTSSYKSIVSLISPGTYEKWKNRILGKEEASVGGGEKREQEKEQGQTGKDGSG